MKLFLISAWVVIVLTLAQKVNGAYRADQPWATPLINAVFKNDENLVKRLLANGANASATTGSGYTALMYAAKEGKEKMVELLVTKAADAKASTNYEGKTALMYAARYGNKKMVELLLPKSDAKATTNGNYYGMTALMYAALGANDKSVELLLPKSDAKAVDNYGLTALDYAKSRGNNQIIELLQQYN